MSKSKPPTTKPKFKSATSQLAEPTYGREGLNTPSWQTKVNNMLYQAARLMTFFGMVAVKTPEEKTPSSSEPKTPENN